MRHDYCFDSINALDAYLGSCFTSWALIASKRRGDDSDSGDLVCRIDSSWHPDWAVYRQDEQ